MCWSSLCSCITASLSSCLSSQSRALHARLPRPLLQLLFPGLLWFRRLGLGLVVVIGFNVVWVVVSGFAVARVRLVLVIAVVTVTIVFRVLIAVGCVRRVGRVIVLVNVE